MAIKNNTKAGQHTSSVPAAIGKRSTKKPTRATTNTKSVTTSGTSPNGQVTARTATKVGKKAANRSTLFNRIKNVPIFKG